MYFEQTWRAHGAIIHKRQYAPISELLPLIVTGRRAIEALEKGLPQERRKEKMPQGAG